MSPTSVVQRFGVRMFGTSEARRVFRVAGLLYLVCGVSILQAWVTARGDIAHPELYLTSGVVVVALGLAVLVSASVLRDEMVDTAFPFVALSMTFGGAVLVPIILYWIGFSEFAMGSVVYILPLFFGFWLLSRPLAVALLVTVAAGHAVLVAVSENVVAPATQWLFLLAILATAGVLLGGLVDRFDNVARSEAEAKGALADVNRELAEVNRTLEARVAEQVDELERVSRLRRFLSPQVADAIVSSGSESFLEAHRREIAVFFCDLRGFTSFASHVEPEEVISVLNDYYEAVGMQLNKFEATVGDFAGDGIMAYLNDPNPCERPGTRAIEMALAMRDPMEELCGEWVRQGYDLGYGIGIALGHATLGVVGFEGRYDYTPIGTVVNLASRLCDEATTRQILVDRRCQASSNRQFESHRLNDITLKGFSSPVPVYEVLGELG